MKIFKLRVYKDHICINICIFMFKIRLVTFSIIYKRLLEAEFPKEGYKSWRIFLKFRISTRCQYGKLRSVGGGASICLN